MAVTPTQGATVDPNNSNAVILPSGFIGQTSAPSANQPAPPPPVSQTTDASAIQTNQTTDNSIPFVAQPAPVNGQAINASVNTNTAQPTPDTTPAQAQQTTILGRIANMIGGQSSLATDQTNAETAAGLPDMANTISDLTNQLQGITDKGTLLANQAAPGGAIDNQEQLNATGRGITAAGLAPQNSADLRNNQIQQNALAAEALPLKALLLTAQGKYNQAKDAADKAGQVIFDGITQQINGAKAQLDALAPQLSRDEAKQAAQTQAALTAQANAVAQQKADYSSGQALLAGAMKTNGTDPQAKMAIQQALQISPQDPQYLQKVGSLVAQYQQDPNAIQAALDAHQASVANTAKTNAEAAAAAQNGLNTTDFSSFANLLPDYNGQKYVTSTQLEGMTTSEKAAYTAAARQAGYPTLSPTAQNALSSVTTATQQLNDFGRFIATGDNGKPLLPNTYFGQPAQFVDVNLNKYLSTNNQLQGFDSWKLATLPVLNALKGVGGSGGASRLFNQAEDLLPNSTDTVGSAKAKIDVVNKLLADVGNGVLGKTSTQSNTQSGADFASSTPNYTQDLADAKAAIQQGADPAQVKARMLTKYKQVDL